MAIRSRALASLVLARVLLCGTFPQLPEARDLYYQGIYGNKDAGQRADALFSELHRQAPDNPLITVYYGSLRLVEAEHTWALWRKNSLSKEGVHLMNQAVGSDPDTLEIRFVRAATERELPAFFGLKRQAEDDICWLHDKTEEAVRNGKFEPKLAAATFFYYGLICEERAQRREAIEAWREAVQIAPASHSGKLAAGKLKQVQ